MRLKDAPITVGVIAYAWPMCNRAWTQIPLNKGIEKPPGLLHLEPFMERWPKANHLRYTFTRRFKKNKKNTIYIYGGG